MAKQQANVLKVKKQSSEAGAQMKYRDMQMRYNFYNVYKGKKLVAANCTMVQAVRQFSPISQFRLEPVSGNI
jgi:hypothetical protein